MNFKSKTEAYSYAILFLDQLRTKTNSNGESYSEDQIDTCLNQIKIAIENHEQGPGVVVGHLLTFNSNEKLSNEDTDALDGLINVIQTSSYEQTTAEKFNNPLARRFESEIGISLLEKPTEAMMRSVKRVSDELLKLIEDLGTDFESALDIFTESSHDIAFGSLKAKPTTEQIKQFLNENKSENLAEIMHIHFKMAQNITRIVPIKNAPGREPVGELANIVKKVFESYYIHPEGGLKDFFAHGIAEKGGFGTTFRSHICDKLMYGSLLYKAFDGRGRGQILDQPRTQQMGLMLSAQMGHTIGLPDHSSSWAADCKIQLPDLDSPYVRDLVENDAVYIAGPSGMTSLFLNQMEILANFETEDLKKNYLSAVVGYMIGGGFHSIHEVIGPAQYALNLVPGYEVHPPTMDKRAPPPNYNQFFAQQAKIDPEFSARRDVAWQNYTDYFRNKHDPTKISIPDNLKESMLKEINGYISNDFLARGNAKGGVSFFTKAFRNEDLTKAKLHVAISFRDKLEEASTVDELKFLIQEAKKSNTTLEGEAKKVYGPLTKSGLVRAIDNIQSALDDYEQHQTNDFKNV